MTAATLLSAAALGTVLPWVPIALAALAVWYLGRHGGGTALAEMERANKILERQLELLRGRVDSLEQENSELKGRTDVAIAIEREMAKHEERSQTRHELTTVILGLIAERLGPENGDGPVDHSPE